MTHRTIEVASTHGLHARPAALFVQAAAKAGRPVRLAKGGREVDAASILGVVSLGVSRGDEVTLTVDGEDADRIIDELAAFLRTDHDAAPAAAEPA